MVRKSSGSGLSATTSWKARCAAWSIWRGAPERSSGSAAVDGIAGHRRAEPGQGRAHLVQEARLEVHLHQARVAQPLDHAPLEPARARSRAGGGDVREDAHPRGSVLRHHQTHLGAPRVVQGSQRDGAVALVHPVAAEGVAQPPPGVAAGGQHDRAGGVHVQAVHDPTPQSAFAHPVELRRARYGEVEQRAGLAFLQGMHRHAGGFVEDEPAAALGQDGEGRLGLRHGVQLGARRELLHLHPRTRGKAHALVAGTDLAPVHPHTTPGQQPAHVGARQTEAPGQQHVQARAGGVGIYLQDASGGNVGHTDILLDIGVPAGRMGAMSGDHPRLRTRSIASIIGRGPGSAGR